jgi:hypothetical protein
MECHTFTTLKPHTDRAACKHVDLRGVRFQVHKSGKVYYWQTSAEGYREIAFLSPLSAEVRKASGWFK